MVTNQEDNGNVKDEKELKENWEPGQKLNLGGPVSFEPIDMDAFL
jgi:hypothetical protein